MQRSFQLSKQKQSLLLPLMLIGLLFLGGCDKKMVVKAPEKTGEETQTVDSTSKSAADTNQIEPQETQSTTKTPEDPETAQTSPAEENWISLFDGESLDGWEGIEFGGEGDFSVTDDGAMSLEAGDPLTGFSSTRDDLPKTNYEVSLSARKLDGIDFFCGLTFPVADSHCTLIVGGWGGSTVGLSCIDDKDASSNDTSVIWPVKFNEGQWYKVRVRVEPDNIKAWLDDEIVIDLVTTGKNISLRGDTSLCTPMGACSFMTHAEFKDFQYRILESEPEAKK